MMLFRLLLILVFTVFSAKLLLVKESGEIRRITDGDFPRHYYDMPNWKIVEVPETKAEMEAKYPQTETVGDCDTFYVKWYHTDKKWYKMQTPVHFEMKYDTLKSAVDTTIDEKPENTLTPVTGVAP